MTHLVPELRPDINGKLVTRHVRPDSTEQATKEFPSPALTPAKKSAEDLKSVQSSLFNVLEYYRSMVEGTDEDEYDEDEYNEDDDGIELGFDPNELLEPSSLRKRLSALPDRTISHIWSMIESKSSSDDYEIALLHALTYDSNDSQLIEYLTHFYDDISGFYPDRDMLGDPDANSYTVLRDYMQGLRNYESVGYELPENIYEATQEELTLMESLHYLNFETGDDEGNGDPALGRIVMDHPDKVEDIIEIVRERDTRDTLVIREIIESKTPSIRSGLL